MDPVGEHGGAALPGAGGAQVLGHLVAVEDVVAQHQGGGRVADEIGADDEGLGQAVRAGLARRSPGSAPTAAVAEQLLEAGRVLGVEMIRMSRMPASISVVSG
jgi:hypothetical protein